jgi:chromosome segregation ATPase
MPRGISEADVHQAADALVGQGERPTVERIRAHLGTGSPNTVTRWLDTWWQGLAGRLSAQAAVLALPAAPETVVALAGQWWAQALAAARAEADRAVAEERGKLDAARRDLTEQAQACQAEVAKYAGVAEQARQLHVAAEQRLADVQRTCDTQAEQLRDLGVQRDSAHLRAERLDGDLARALQHGHARETAWAAEREDQARYVRALEDRVHNEVDRARQETKAVRTELTARAQHLQNELHDARDREAATRQALAQAQQEAAAALARADTLAQLGRAGPTSRAVTRSPRKGGVKSRKGG